MKSRTQFLIGMGVIIVMTGIALFTFLTRNQQPGQIFPATVNRDCAPWDGPAFTVSIPYDSASTIMISIWQSPDRLFPSTFSFPDETGWVGNAIRVTSSDEYEQLIGKVILGRVEQGTPVKGEFRLRAESGEQFRGKFEAQWGNEMVYCG